MRKLQGVVVVWVCLVCSLCSIAGDFKLYPGATLEEQATQEMRETAQAANMAHLRSAVYTTSDSFQQVCSFYKGIAEELSMPRSSGTSGSPKKYENYELWEAYFIFDGAKDLATSKLWVKVQRPYIGVEVRNMTAIVVVEKP